MIRSEPWGIVIISYLKYYSDLSDSYDFQIECVDIHITAYFRLRSSPLIVDNLMIHLFHSEAKQIISVLYFL